MDQQAPARGGAERGRGERGGRGFGARGGRGGGRGGRFGGRGGDKDDWTPLTKLGRLVKAGKIQSLEIVYTHSIPIKEAPIVDRLLRNQKRKEDEEVLYDEIMCILSVQKQTKAGQRTRFKAVVAVGDRKGHVGIGIKVAKEVQIAIKGALLDAKMRIIPVRRGYWGSRIGAVHTVPIKVKGKCGSCTVRLVPAPRGTGCVAAQVSKKILQFAGIEDVYTTCTGQTRTRENFCRAVFACLKKTYSFLTPDLWPKTEFIQSPFVKYWQDLEKMENAKGRGGRDMGRGRRGQRGGPRGGRGRGRGGPRGGAN